MNTQPEVIKQSQLLNRLVLDRRTAEEVGRVEQLWLDPQSHQVIGLTCKAGLLRAKRQSFTWSQVESIGNDSLLVNTNSEAVELEKPEQAISGLGHELWTDTGNKVGKLVDYILLPRSGGIVSYLYSSNGWRGVMEGIYLLSPGAIVSVGTKRVIVEEAAVQEPEKYAEGLHQRMTQAAEMLKEDYKKTQQDLEVMKRRAQELAEQAKDRGQGFAEQAKDKAQIVGREAQELAEQARIKAQEVSEKAKAKISEVQAQRQKTGQSEIADDEIDITDDDFDVSDAIVEITPQETPINSDRESL